MKKLIHRWAKTLIPFLMLVFMLAACGLLADETTAPENEAESTLPTPANTPDLTDAATQQPDIPIAAPILTFTVWTVPEISTDSTIPGGDILAGQMEAFNLTHPDISLQVEQKSVLGQGSILNYLRTGRDVAPTVLPDVVLIPSGQLPDMVADEQIFPLGALEEAMYTDLFPVAREMATVDGELMGYPYTISHLDHLAYDGTIITTAIPTTWNELVNLQGGTFVFPAAGPAGAELLLQFYLEQGGTLTDEDGTVRLETEPLATALSQFFGASANDFIFPESDNLNNLQDTWRLYQENAASIALSEAEVMLPPRTQGATSRFAVIPGTTNTFSPLVSSWIWAVSTPDPARQSIAAEFISWLGSAANMGEWSLQSGQIPSRRTAFEAWPAGDAYYNFLRDQADIAEPLPPAATTTVMNALTAALVSVLNGSETPAGAAQTAAEAVNP
jgi:ABC-type glycerol-3-phosphate transport system substrate-binding protein